MQTQHRSAAAIPAPGRPQGPADGPIGSSIYQFVYLDAADHFQASDQHPYPDDEAAQVHAQRLLAGATLVVVYRDGARTCLLANLC